MFSSPVQSSPELPGLRCIPVVSYMSNITTDFIAATKKIHADVRSILATLRVIDADVKIIREHSVSMTEQNQQAHNADTKQAEGMSGGSQSSDVNQTNGNEDNGKQEREPYFKALYEGLKREARKPKFLLEVLALIGLFAYTCETKRTNDLTSGIAETAVKQLAVSQRPLVGLDDALDAFTATDIQFKPNGDAWSNYIIRAKNYSASNPAQNVASFAQLLITEDSSVIRNSRDGICGEHLVGNRDMGMVLFPGRLKAFSTSQSLFEKKNIVSKASDGKVQALFAGCIGYRDESSGTFYHTGFLYRLIDPATGLPVRFDPSNHDPVISGNWIIHAGSSIN